VTGWFSGLGSNSTAINATLGALNHTQIRYTLLAQIGAYPASSPAMAPSMATDQYYGWAVVAGLPNETMLTVYYNLTGMPPNAMGGLHVHTGTTCRTASAVGGHYWTPATMTDPWNTTWSSDGNGNAIGSFNVSTGYQYAGNLGHALVVHLPNGTRVGCGVLDS
jgi:Cu/Zn superoxide dismutase